MAQIVDDPDRVPEIAKPVAGSDFPWRPAIETCRRDQNLIRVRYCIDGEISGHVFALAAWDDLDPGARAAATACADASGRMFYARLARCIRLQVDLAEQRAIVREQQEWTWRPR